MSQTPQTQATAAMLAIGDELLSGRTKDKNIGHFAEVMTLSGIDLKEVRIVADEEYAIVEAINALRARYDFVVTSGGIGPTHDDITADAIGAAFGLEVTEHPEAVELLQSYYAGRDLEFTPARRRMTRTPVGASTLITGRSSFSFCCARKCVSVYRQRSSRVDGNPLSRKCALAALRSAANSGGPSADASSAFQSIYVACAIIWS